MNARLDAPTAKPLILYHADCIDGMTAYWVTASALAKEHWLDAAKIDAMSVQYGDDFSLLSTIIREGGYTLVYIVDFSFSWAVTQDLVIKLPNVNFTYLDHHKSAFLELSAGSGLDVDPKATYELGEWVYAKDNLRIVLSKPNSGASLAWTYFNPTAPRPVLVTYAKDYDLWLFERPETKAIVQYLDTLTKDYDTWNCVAIELADANDYAYVLKIGTALLEAHNKLVAELVAKGAVPVTIDGEEGLCCNAPYAFRNEVGDKLAELSGTYGAVWSQIRDKTDPNNVKVLLSLRSRGGCDVEVMAKAFGGGGHKNAAAFVLYKGLSNGAVTIWSGESEDVRNEEHF